LHSAFAVDIIGDAAQVLSLGSMTHSSPFGLRVAVASSIGIALVTGWLQFIYERFVVGVGGVIFVYTPRWWVVLEFLSSSALVIFAFILRRHDRRLAAISWGAFGLGLLGTILLYIFGHGICCFPIDLSR
jgi:hypothetical protein